jgi:hypothetical protein
VVRAVDSQPEAAHSIHTSPSNQAYRSEGAVTPELAAREAVVEKTSVAEEASVVEKAFELAGRGGGGRCGDRCK